ncbi:MAG: glutamine synthetase type III, partial [Clostridium sp.]|nr:glutamine synthetase type III [Clostridium sp.]
LHLLGYQDVTRVDVTVGCEQEYFLIDKDFYKKRKDLVFCGRTLLGAAPPKGQEMEDHYFGVLKPKIAAFMHDLDTELWKLGVPAKTKHNEVAPAQYEMAPVFEVINIATDHNQLTMEMLKKVADRHGFACLLHEKPFDGVNGSGKHDNWSLVTDTGENLLNPGKTPAKNTQFLVFLTAVIAAVDDYAGLIRASVATAGNDHRLGGNEAPPAVISMFVGDELERVLESIEEDRDMAEGAGGMMELAKMLPLLKQDNTDRNRTSPFAFTGNKFEFRMPGSSLSAADPNIVLNTAVAEELDRFYEALEAVPAGELEEAVHKLIKETIQTHRRIVFNGNGYTDEWIEEAARRGLPNLHSVPEAAAELLKKQNMDLCVSHGIYTEEEILSRHAIMLENYIKTIHIESLTLQNMVTKDFTDGLFSYMKTVEQEMLQKKQVLPDLPCSYETDILKALNACAEQLSGLLGALARETENAETIGDLSEKACFYHDVILAEMTQLRAAVDAAEARIPGSFIPYPTYEEMLFHLRKYDA